MKCVPISSNKSMIGHTLTAAGAVEAVMALMTIAKGRIPPTINHHVPDPAIPLDVVPERRPRRGCPRVLSNSFGFGGQNTCLVFTAGTGLMAALAAARVLVTGGGRASARRSCACSRPAATT